jgi:hypothetical protein
VTSVAVYAALTVWFVVMAAVAATLMVRHTVPMPAIADGADVAIAIETLRGPEERGRWMVVHVLYEECRCSIRIAEHLQEVGPASDVGEHVLLVGEDEALRAALGARGFDARGVTAEQLSSEFHVLSAPILIIADGEGTVRYAGGYTRRKQGPAPMDREILANLRAGQSGPPLPAYGCAVSARLQRQLNPLAIP